MNRTGYRRAILHKTDLTRSRKWFGPLEVKLSPWRRFAARERGKSRRPGLALLDYGYPPSPHARAAGAPTGRSLFEFRVSHL